MFATLDKIRKRTKAKELNVLLLQSGYEGYCQEFANLEDVNFYVYNPKTWGIPIESTPANFILIHNTSQPIVGCFDKILCIGKAEEIQIAKELQDRFGLDLICVHNSSEDNYCPRPFTFNVRQKVECSPEVEVSMLPFFGRDSMVTIPPVEKDIASGNKQNHICIFEHVPPNVLQAFQSACSPHKFAQFNSDNLLSAKVFLDTIVGLTPHLIKALSFGCIPVLPYSVEAERLLGDTAYFYKGYDEVLGLIEDAMASNISQYQIKDVASLCFTNKQDFINKWKYVLGRSI